MTSTVRLWCERITEGISKPEFLALLKEGSPVVAGVLLELATQDNLGLLTHFQHILKEQHPSLYQVAAVPKPAGTAVEVAANQLVVHMLDVVQLQGTSKEATENLNYRGQWWKVTRGSRDKWFLTSIPLKLQGKAATGKHIPYEIAVLKTSDPQYRIVNVCVFPNEFRYKDYE